MLSLISADTGHALVLLDPATGRVQALTGTARTAWYATAKTPAPMKVGTRPASWGTDEISVSLQKIPTPLLRWLVRAALAITLTLAIRSIGPSHRAFARMVAIAAAAARIGSAASRHDAEAALRAVRWAARYVPARMACLEESVATMITLAVSGHHGDWRQGVASDPVSMHAWIEVDGQPVDEPVATSRYTALIQFPPPASDRGETS
jgi:Transglutaminase-like superfamily